MFNEENDNQKEKIIEDTQPNAEKTEKALDDVLEAVKDIAGDVGEDIENVFDNVKDIAEGVADKVKDVAKDIEGDFKDKYLKVLAEMENLRKRFDSEKMDVLKFRASSFIQTILPTVDMFEMAMNTTNASEEVKNWIVGFEMILQGFKMALEQEGVKEITVNKGDDFDANIHHAIEEVETDEIEAGKIFEVKMKGYMIHDKLLRPATVTVAKALAEATEEEDVE